MLFDSQGVVWVYHYTDGWLKKPTIDAKEIVHFGHGSYDSPDGALPPGFVGRAVEKSAVDTEAWLSELTKDRLRGLADVYGLQMGPNDSKDVLIKRLVATGVRPPATLPAASPATVVPAAMKAGAA